MLFCKQLWQLPNSVSLKKVRKWLVVFLVWNSDDIALAVEQVQEAIYAWRLHLNKWRVELCVFVKYCTSACLNKNIHVYKQTITLLVGIKVVILAVGKLFARYLSFWYFPICRLFWSKNGWCTKWKLYCKWLSSHEYVCMYYRLRHFKWEAIFREVRSSSDV